MISLKDSPKFFISPIFKGYPRVSNISDHWGLHNLVLRDLADLPRVAFGYTRDFYGLSIRIRHKRDKIGVKDISGREWWDRRGLEEVVWRLYTRLGGSGGLARKVEEC